MSPGGLPGGGAAGRGEALRAEVRSLRGASRAALRIPAMAGGKSESNFVEQGRAAPVRKGQAGAPASPRGWSREPRPRPFGHLEVGGGHRASWAPFPGLQPPRLNHGCDGRRGRRDSCPISPPQVVPWAARPTRACSCSSSSDAGRRPGRPSWDPRREKGSPRAPTGSPAGTPPGTPPGPQCPAPRSGSHSIPKCRDPHAHPARTPTHPRTRPCLPLPGGRCRR